MRTAARCWPGCVSFLGDTNVVSLAACDSFCVAWNVGLLLFASSQVVIGFWRRKKKKGLIIVWVRPGVCFIIPRLFGLENRKPVLVMTKALTENRGRCVHSSVGCLLPSMPCYTLVWILVSFYWSLSNLRATLSPLKATYWLTRLFLSATRQCIATGFTTEHESVPCLASAS